MIYIDFSPNNFITKKCNQKHKINKNSSSHVDIVLKINSKYFTFGVHTFFFSQSLIANKTKKKKTITICSFA